MKKILSLIISLCIVFTGTVIVGSGSVFADVYGEKFYVEKNNIELSSGESVYVKVVWLDDCTLTVTSDNDKLVSASWYEDSDENSYIKITANDGNQGQCTVRVYDRDYDNDSIDINVTVKAGEGIIEEPAPKTGFKYQKLDPFDCGYEINHEYDDLDDLPEVYFKEVVLDANTAAAKKINAAIEKDCLRFISSKKVDNVYGTFFEYPPNYGENNYFCYVDSKVTYNNKYVISIKYTEKWYAGGALNTTVYGRTYSLKTGKRLYLGDVTNTSLGKIKKQLTAKVKNSYGQLGVNRIKKIKSKKSMDFYLASGKRAYVTFKPYELGYGGYSAVYKIKSKYS